MYHSNFTGNIHGFGGAIWSNNTSVFIINASRFVQNEAGYQGGAIRINNLDPIYMGSTVVITNSEFIQNVAKVSTKVEGLNGCGGALGLLEANYGRYTISGNSFVGNRAENFGGAIYSYSTKVMLFFSTRNTFIENIGEVSGGGSCLQGLKSYEEQGNFYTSNFFWDR